MVYILIMPPVVDLRLVPPNGKHELLGPRELLEVAAVLFNAVVNVHRIPYRTNDGMHILILNRTIDDIIIDSNTFFCHLDYLLSLFMPRRQWSRPNGGVSFPDNVQVRFCIWPE